MKTSVFRRLNITLSSRLNGKIVRVPLSAGLGGANRALSEPWMYSVLKKLLSERSGAFIDVGVNLGQTLIKVKSLDANRRYVGFEPNVACVAYVQELIRVNHFTRAVVLPCALFNRDCVLALERFSENEADSSASVIQEFRAGERVVATEYVSAFTFSSIAKALNIDQIGFIKIDVEGAELEVVGTLRDTIAEFRPIVLIEVLPVYSDEHTFRLGRQQELEVLLVSLSYKWFRVEKTADDDFAGLEPLRQIGIHSDLQACDYLVVPAELEGQITSRM